MESQNKYIISAINCYERHKNIQKKWRENNKEKLNNNSRSYYYRMKEDPEKYEKYLERCRQKYNKKKENDDEFIEKQNI